MLWYFFKKLHYGEKSGMEIIIFLGNNGPNSKCGINGPFFAPIVHRREAALIIHSYINFIMLVKKGAENWCKLLTFHAIFSLYFGYYLEDFF